MPHSKNHKTDSYFIVKEILRKFDAVLDAWPEVYFHLQINILHSKKRFDILDTVSERSILTDTMKC